MKLTFLSSVLVLGLAAGVSACGSSSTAPGKLTCPAGSIACANHCVDPQTDQANCGACGKTCAAGEVCAAGTCATSCPTGQIVCNGQCVDPSTDRAYCGASADCTASNAGTACAAGQVCTGGTCAANCPTGEIVCGGTCVDPSSNRDFCGASADCTGTNAGTACPAGQVCAAGTCAVSCPTGTVKCGDQCVDPSTDRAYCGASADCTGSNAGTACAAGEICSGGSCVVSCPTGQIDCGGTCVDPQSDAAHCGATADCTGPNAGTACASGQVCVSGACATSCPTGQIDCGGQCIDPSTDATYCGASADCTGSNAGTACASGQACASGTCVTSCPAGEIACGGACIDPTTDLAHCGATADCTGPNAGTACAAGQVCDGGQCTATCGSAFTTCPATASSGAYCASTQTDPANCGSCGAACTPQNVAGPACAGGSCGYTSCSAGYGDCDGNTANGCETNVTSDVKNCGACGAACNPLHAAGATCTASACGYTTCNAGYGDCDASKANGCETDLKTDSMNCGACGNMCQGGEHCSNGTCGYTYPAPSLVSMGGDAATVNISQPRNTAFTIGTPAPATVYYTTDGSTPKKGATGTTAASAPVDLGSLATSTVKWYADYGSAVESTVHTLNFTVASTNNLGDIVEHLDFAPTGGVAKGPTVTALPGQTVKATVNWQAWASNSAGYCPGCVVQFVIGVDGVGQVSCQNFLTQWPGTTSTWNLSFKAPTKPGHYYMRASEGLAYTCAGAGYPGGTEIGEVIVP